MVKKGSWVTIESVVLLANERAENLPEDTRKVDLKKWVKGALIEDTEIGNRAVIKTQTGREESGILVEVNPVFSIGYGLYVPELKTIGDRVRSLMEKGEEA